MNAKVETDSYPLNWLRWLVVVALVAVGVVGNSHYSSEVDWFYRVLALLVLGLVAFLLLLIRRRVLPSGLQ